MWLSLELLWLIIDYASSLLTNTPTHDNCHNIGRGLLQVLNKLCREELFCQNHPDIRLVISFIQTHTLVWRRKQMIIHKEIFCWRETSWFDSNIHCTLCTMLAASSIIPSTWYFAWKREILFVSEDKCNNAWGPVTLMMYWNGLFFILFTVKTSWFLSMYSLYQMAKLIIHVILKPLLNSSKSCSKKAMIQIR